MAFLAAYLLLVIKTIVGLALIAVVLVVWLLSLPGARRRERAEAAEDASLAALALRQRHQFGSPPPFRRDYSALFELFLGGGGMAVLLAFIVLKDAPQGWPIALVILGIPAMAVSIWRDDEKARERRHFREFYEAVIEANQRAH